MKINLKKKSHVKGYALRGAGLRKQVTLRCISFSSLMAVILSFKKKKENI